MCYSQPHIQPAPDQLRVGEAAPSPPVFPRILYQLSVQGVLNNQSGIDRLSLASPLKSTGDTELVPKRKE